MSSTPPESDTTTSYPDPPSSLSVMALVVVLVTSLLFALFCSGLATALLIPAAQAAREASRGVASANQLRRIGVAFQSYHRDYGVFPPLYVQSNSGEKLYSWRVLLLPYLDQRELYEAFHLDEPWDSPHNRLLLDRIPPCYRSPNESSSVGTTTSYVTIAHESAILQPLGSDLSGVTDGLASTLLALECRDSQIPWSAPQDVALEQAVDRWGDPEIRRVLILYADGSTQQLEGGLSGPILRAMVSRNGAD